jgi:DNA-binding NtrC family response regulator
MVDSVHPNVLVVLNENKSVHLVLEVMASRNLRATVARDARGALAKLAERTWDLVLSDAEAPAGGMELLREIRRHAPECPVVLVGETDAAALAVSAMREGCRDFLLRPLTAEAVGAMLSTLLPNHAVPLAAAEEDPRSLYQIAGKSRRLLDTVALARKLAPSTVPVLITGESGTGKELLSYLIHRESRRAHAPYIRVNCAALSDSLLESELFGHEKGAFTGACAQRKGRFELAHGGTLLLDEISETNPRLQAELLRVLEQQDFERVGGSQSVRVNVRVLSTSNRDLSAEVEQGRFRRDLYYRISGVRIHMPALRDRKEDIPALAWHFVNLYAREINRRVTAMDPRTLQTLCDHPWPGNVRQLRNVVRAMLLLGEGPTLKLGEAAAMLGDSSEAQAAEASLKLQDLEREAIIEALRRTNRNQARAAEMLGITDRTLREKLRRYREGDQVQLTGENRW